MTRKLTTLLILLAATLMFAGNSYADGWWWGGAPNGLFNNWMNINDRQIPYFAEHPPVYYSHIVPRTYGQSPYAYWPGPYTPVLAPEPIMIDNPYFDVVPEEVPAPAERGKKKTTSTDKTTRAVHRGGPLVVLNPYVDQQPAVASSSK